MHTDQEDTRPATSKVAPAPPTKDRNNDSISLDSPCTPAQESRHTIPAQVTITVTDPGPDMACTIDHESPGFVHEGAMQRAPQEQREWTYHVYKLSRVTEHWKTTTELEGDPEREKVIEAITSWAHEEARQKDPSELDPGKPQTHNMGNERIPVLALQVLQRGQEAESQRHTQTSIHRTRHKIRFHSASAQHKNRPSPGNRCHNRLDPNSPNPRRDRPTRTRHYTEKNLRIVAL